MKMLILNQKCFLFSKCMIVCVFVSLFIKQQLDENKSKCTYTKHDCCRLRCDWEWNGWGRRRRLRLQNRAGWAGGKQRLASHFHTLLLLRRAMLCVTKNTPESWNGENRISPEWTEEATRQSFVSEYTYFLLGSFLAGDPPTSDSLPPPIQS